MLVEAKTTCPNKANIGNDVDKEKKYKAYFDEIVQKFEDSIGLFSACMMGQYGSDLEIGEEITGKRPFTKSRLRFILVVTEAEEDWLQGPKSELEQRMLHLRKLYRAEILVLNKALAKTYGLIK